MGKSWNIHYKWAIFNCYVSSPEGISHGNAQRPTPNAQPRSRHRDRSRDTERCMVRGPPGPQNDTRWREDPLIWGMD